MGPRLGGTGGPLGGAGVCAGRRACKQAGRSLAFSVPDTVNETTIPTEENR